MLRATASFRPRPRSSEGWDWAIWEDGEARDMSSENNKIENGKQKIENGKSKMEKRREEHRQE
jgi:hypothetical protein